MSASSSSPYAIETIIDLLEGADSTTWTNTAPSRIGPIWDYSHNDRINYPDPALYVWEPVDADASKFSIDGDNMLVDNSVEVICMTLDPQTVKEYQKDVLNILSDYYDNNQRTEFYTIEPDSKSDLRNEHNPDTTDHYLTTVQVQPRKFADAGV